MKKFREDLREIIEKQFDLAGVIYDAGLDVHDLATSYFQALTRTITDVPRTVHFSDAIHGSLGALAREKDAAIRQEVEAAWGAVFWLRWLLSEGKNVNSFLRKRIVSGTGQNSNDGLLFDYGMHHFHLNNTTDRDGFTKRSRYLLFAVVTQKHAYFIDVRKHPKGVDLGWVRQDLMEIVNSNWPDLLEANAIRGVLGTTVTDSQKQELRRKNVNHLSPLEGKVHLPLGGGTMGDGSSMRCRFEAMRLLTEIDRHQCVFEDQRLAVKSALKGNGIPVDDDLKLDLVLLQGLNLPPETLAALRADDWLSRDLNRMGFVVVEHATKTPIIVGLRSE